MSFRQMFSSELRQRVISRVLESDTTYAQIAHDLGCSRRSISRWFQEYRQQGSSFSEAVASATFVPVKVVDSQPQHGCSLSESIAPATFVPVKIIDSRPHSVEIVIPNGITLRLTDASPQYIADLLQALAPC